MTFVRWWDSLPVKGIVATLAVALGFFLAYVLGPGGSSCTDAHGLRHVYDPSRLQVIAECQTITFRVVAWRTEHDGDVHVNGVVVGGGWLDPANYTDQHGYTVVEFVPGDPEPKSFFDGELLQLTTTKVYDQGHRHGTANGWIEAHPVFAVKDVTPADALHTPNRPIFVPSEP